MKKLIRFPFALCILVCLLPFVALGFAYDQFSIGWYYGKAQSEAFSNWLLEATK